MTNSTLFKTESPVRLRFRLYLVPAEQEDNGADKSRFSLLEWMKLRAKNARQAALEAGRGQAGNAKSNMSALKHLGDYINSIGSGGNVTLQEVDKDFCRGFASHLELAKNHRGGNLSPNSQFLYFSKFSAALRARLGQGSFPPTPLLCWTRASGPFSGRPSGATSRKRKCRRLLTLQIPIPGAMWHGLFCFLASAA